MYTPSLCKQTISINEKTHKNSNQISPLENANIAPQQRKGEVVKTKRHLKKKEFILRSWNLCIYSTNLKEF